MTGPRRGGLPPTDLASTFGRAGGLVGALPPAPARTTKTPSPHDSDVPAPAEQPAAQQPTADSDGGARQDDDLPTTSASGSSDTDMSDTHTSDTDSTGTGRGTGAGRPSLKGVVVYVPLSVRDRLSTYRRTCGATTAQTLLDAFDSTYDELPHLLGTKPAVDATSRFERPNARRTSTQHDPLVQVYVNLSAHNLAVIDEITQAVAPEATRARSKVAAAALDRFLPPAGDAP